MFEVTVEESGEISYWNGGEDSDPDDGGVSPRPSTPPECNQTAYKVEDLKEYGTYDFYIGDGSFPASLTQSEFQTKVNTSILNIVTAHNDCGMPDNISASASAAGTTTYESDMTNSGGYTDCTDGTVDDRDHVSTWDAGNLDKSTNNKVPVARTCYWGLPSPGIKNDLLEADVRFNITDYDFTIAPNAASCNDSKYDVVSVGVHEAGHVLA